MTCESSVSEGKMQSELDARLVRIVGIDEQNFNRTGTLSLARTFAGHQIYLEDIGLNTITV